MQKTGFGGIKYVCYNTKHSYVSKSPALRKNLSVTCPQTNGRFLSNKGSGRLALNWNRFRGPLLPLSAPFSLMSDKGLLSYPTLARTWLGTSTHTTCTRLPTVL